MSEHRIAVFTNEIYFNDYIFNKYFFPFHAFRDFKNLFTGFTA
jgi:hypothetical protein